MKQFLFITHKTPSALQSPLRKDLFGFYLEALHAQTYRNWKVLAIGEEESEQQNIKTVKLDASSREAIPAKLAEIYERRDVCNYLESSDYIVKLDDDDVISPTILENASLLDFDVYHDDWHTFYDISSGMLTQEFRSWIPSTCIHATRHALAPINDGPRNYYSNSVLYTDHSKVWHTYYRDKHIVKAKREHPVYLRILSPTSITAGAKKAPILALSDIDFNQYYTYLKSFGYWHGTSAHDFDAYKAQLSKIWMDFSGSSQEPIRGISSLDAISDKFFYYAKRIRRLF